MKIRSTDPCVNTGAFRVLQCLSRGFDVFQYSPAQPAYSCILNHTCNLAYTLEIAGRRNRKTGLNYINAQGFKLEGDLNFFFGIKFTSGYLLTIPQRRIKYV